MNKEQQYINYLFIKYHGVRNEKKICLSVDLAVTMGPVKNPKDWFV